MTDGQMANEVAALIVDRMHPMDMEIQLRVYIAADFYVHSEDYAHEIKEIEELLAQTEAEETKKAQHIKHCETCV